MAGRVQVVGGVHPLTLVQRLPQQATLISGIAPPRRLERRKRHSSPKVGQPGNLAFETHQAGVLQLDRCGQMHTGRFKHPLRTALHKKNIGQGRQQLGLCQGRRSFPL